MAENETEQKNGGNGATSLARLLNQLNVPTLIAIAVFGGGNFIQGNQTREAGVATREEARHLIQQVNEMHDAISQFERRQKDELQKATDLLDNQNTLLRNQSMMISNQQKLLTQLKPTPP